MNKIVYILRGIPGNGKTTFAKSIQHLCDTAFVTFCLCCADEWFEDEQGNYKFIQEEIGKAHVWCKNLFRASLETDTEVIVVANTNVTSSDVKFYRNLAIEHNYKVFVLTVENWHEGNDIHNVPEEIKLKMKEQLKNSIRL